MRIKNLLIYFIPLIPSSLIFFYSSYEKSLYLSTFFYIGLIFLFKKYFKKEYIYKNVVNFSSLDYYILPLFIFIIFTQNRFLNIETITWDVSSYLVASNEINYGYIPFETQWESKGPLAIYIYFLLSKIVGVNYVYFKLLNDFILFLTIFIFVGIFKLYDSSKTRYIFFAFLLSSIFSIQWFVSEFTEFYCLPLIAYSNYLYIKNKNSNHKIIGFLFGLSFLINQGSILLYFPILLDSLFNNKNKKKLLKSYILQLVFFLIPNIFFIFVYLEKKLLDVLISNYIYLPLGYIGERASSFYELRVFLREIYNLNFFTYFAIISIFLFYSLSLTFNSSLKIRNLFDLINLNILFAVAYYFVAGHNYYHHLIYLVSFSLFLILKINQKFQMNLIFLLIFASSFVSFIESFKSSFNNLSDLNRVKQEYPLYNLSNIIDSKFEKDNYTVLALDYVLVLYYLEKTNYSYIVHPTNHFQDYITKTLIDLDRIQKNNIIEMLNQRPDVIICNTKAIDNGGRVMSTDPSSYGEDIVEGVYNFCDYKNFEKEYKQIDSSQYRSDPNLNFYYDPYKDMNIFIKNK